MEYVTTTDGVARLWEANADSWTRLSRAGHDVYRDTHNTPAFLSELPPVQGLLGLDIGCGEGTNTRCVANRGAQMTVEVADASALPFELASFDFAVAFMSMMDVADLNPAIEEVFRVLRPGGFFQFSILHPCFAPPVRRPLRDSSGTVHAIEVSDYFVENDGSVEEWTFGRAKRSGGIVELFRVPRFHRTLSRWLNLLIATGFTVEHLHEPMATSEEAARFPDIADTRVAPLFLHIRVRKPE